MTHSPEPEKQKSNISFDFSENNDNYKSYTPPPSLPPTPPPTPAPPTPPPLRKLLKLFRQK